MQLFIQETPFNEKRVEVMTEKWDSFAKVFQTAAKDVEIYEKDLQKMHA